MFWAKHSDHKTQNLLVSGLPDSTTSIFIITVWMVFVSPEVEYLMSILDTHSTLMRSNYDRMIRAQQFSLVLKAHKQLYNSFVSHLFVLVSMGGFNSVLMISCLIRVLVLSQLAK